MAFTSMTPGTERRRRATSQSSRVRSSHRAVFSVGGFQIELVDLAQAGRYRRQLGRPYIGSMSASASGRSLTSWRQNQTSRSSSKITVTAETDVRLTLRISVTPGRPFIAISMG